jgi:protease I
MMVKPLAGRKIAVMAANGFTEHDMVWGQRTLATAGAQLKVVGPDSGLVNSWNGTGWGHHFAVDAGVATVLAADFDGLFVPGGQRSLQKLKENPHCRRIMRGFIDAGKPVCLLGCAVELLATAERAEGHTVTGDTESQSVLVQAGATWADNATHCVDGYLLTTAHAANDTDSESDFWQMLVSHFDQAPMLLAQAA